MYSKFIQNVSAGKSPQELISLSLKFNRQIKGLSQKDVAEAISISRPKYNRIENGRICPDILTLCDLLVFYNITLEQLLNMPPEHGHFPKDPSKKNVDESDCPRHCRDGHNRA